MSADRGTGFGLTGKAKAGLLKRFALGSAKDKDGTDKNGAAEVGNGARSSWSDLPLFKDMAGLRSAARKLGIADPFFRTHDGIATGSTRIDGRQFSNFSSYDYLGLNGDPRIAEAAMAAIQQYGTSVSASRLVAGERPVHQTLEDALARFYEAEACLCFVSGHATNVTVIGQIMKPGDLILHDELIHNSVLQGAQLSGARRLGFAHNDAAAAEKVLATHRSGSQRALLVIEGNYSMDGDIPDLPRFIALARRYDCRLMVDEAHALGVLGDTGHGIAEHFGVSPNEVDIWMGTLSKTLVSCGGYIAGSHDLIDYLKHSSPGFVYSVGMVPSVAASARAALEILEAEPERVARLRRNTSDFLTLAKQAGFDTGTAAGAAIVPILTHSSMKAARLSERMLARGINVQPILYPAVPERAARLRFFLSAAHTLPQIEEAVSVMREEYRKV